jgi:hypothetical protein
MNTDKFFNVIGGVLTIGLVTTLVIHQNTASIIRASGSAFQGVLKTAISGR